MNNSIIDKIKLAHYKNLFKQGKFDRSYIRDHKISKLVVFMVKQDKQSFMDLSPKDKYDVLENGQYILPYRDYNTTAAIVSELFNNGYTNVFNLIDINQIDNRFYDKLIELCNKDETFYKTVTNLLTDNILLDVVKTDSNFINYISKEKRRELVIKDRELIRLLPIEEQVEIVRENLSLLNIEYIDLNVIGTVLKTDPYLFSKLDDETKIVILEDSDLRKIVPKEVLMDFVRDNNKNQHLMLSFALEDINNVKFFNINDNSVRYDFDELSEAFKTMSDKEIVSFILNSKGENLSATDHLKDAQFHNLQVGLVPNLEKKTKFFSNLSINQIVLLIQTDSNYILDVLDKENIELAKSKSIEIFKKMYGEDAFDKLTPSFENLFNSWKNNPSGNSFDELPLENIKILFNDKILKTCSPDLINVYYEKMINNQDVSDIFKEIIETAYGEKALAILESRPNLNVHAINSLEVFDERILGTFGEAFVHNLITYNMYDFSGFLEIVKNPEKLDLFKSYYDIVCKVYGENVETIQRCISEYSFYEELLKDVKGKELNEEQARNLVNVLASQKNILEINSVEDLDNFSKKANENLNGILKWYQSMKDHKDTLDLQNFKDMLMFNIMGLRFYSGVKDRNDQYYGDTIEIISKLYNFSNTEGYTDSEIKVINIITFIANENNPDKIIEYIEKEMNNGNLASRNYLEVNMTISKVKEKEMEELTSKITTIEKLEEACEKEKDKPIEERSIYEEIVDGVKVIHLEGAYFSFFTHDTFGMSLKDILEYEGQAGNLAICTRYSSPETPSRSKLEVGHLIYGPDQDFIGFYSKQGDASTDHISKKVHMKANVNTPISTPEKLTDSHNEASFYRRKRNNKEISNENSGGRVYPMAIVADMSPETLELCRKYNIAIIIQTESKYKKKEELPPEEIPEEIISSGRTL